MSSVHIDACETSNWLFVFEYGVYLNTVVLILVDIKLVYRCWAASWYYMFSLLLINSILICFYITLLFTYFSFTIWLPKSKVHIVLRDYVTLVVLYGRFLLAVLREWFHWAEVVVWEGELVVVNVCYVLLSWCVAIFDCLIYLQATFVGMPLGGWGHSYLFWLASATLLVCWWGCYSDMI